MGPAKYCPRCGAENDLGFSVCRQCGAPLSSTAAPPQYSNWQPAYAIPEIEGVPVSAIEGFVGKNAPYYLRKFAELDRNHSKTSFHAPVFFLTLFLGPVAGSLWFFHRRLNKLGAILLSVGVVVMAASFLRMAPMMRQMTDWLNQMASLANGGYLLPVLKGFSFPASYYIISALFFAVSIACAIVFGLFANGWYKNHVLSSLRAMHDEPDGVTQAKLLARGGTRAGIWVAVLVVYIVADFAITGVLMSGFWSAFMNFMQQVIHNSSGYSYNFRY